MGASAVRSQPPVIDGEEKFAAHPFAVEEEWSSKLREVGTSAGMMRRGVSPKDQGWIKNLSSFHIEVKERPKIGVDDCEAGRTYDIELRGPNGMIDVHATRTVADLEHLWAQLRVNFPAAALPALRRDGGGSSADSPKSLGTAEIQRWLNEICGDSLMFHSRPVHELLGLPHHIATENGALSLTMVAECHEPLMLEIVGYLAENPRDFVAFGGLTSRTIAMQIEFTVRNVWRDMYARKWPVFKDCLAFQGVQDWQRAYKETFLGRYECTLEVFDREKKLGFAMAAMAARVQYEAAVDGYIARYLSASEVRPETIPIGENHRLRFCPPSARPALLSGLRGPGADSTGDARVDFSPVPGAPPASGSAGGASSGAADAVSALSTGGFWGFGAMAKAPELPPYPYRVLEGFEHLTLGAGVELQWKMQYGSPFGWWFGTLEELNIDSNGKTALGVITFRHFPPTSRWYRLEVRFGDAEMRPCFFGGYTGGIRSVSKDEHKHWMRFFPKDPVVF